MFPQDEDESDGHPKLLALDHVPVIQVKYTQGAAVPFQIHSFKAVPDTAFLTGDHGIKISNPKPHDEETLTYSMLQGLYAARKEGEVQAARAQAKMGRRFYTINTYIIFDGFPSDPTRKYPYLIPEQIVGLDAIDPQFTSTLVELINR